MPQISLSRIFYVPRKKRDCLMADSKLSKMEFREKSGAISAQNTEHPLKNCVRIFHGAQNVEINFRGWQNEHIHPCTWSIPPTKALES